MAVLTAETVVVLSGGEDAAARRRLEDFALLLCDQARNHGCNATAAWAEGRLKVRLQEGCAESLQYVIQWLSETAAEQGAVVEVGADEPAGPPIRDLGEGPIPWGTVVHARLSREMLCALPEGAFVVCNTSPGDGAVALGRLGPFASRAEQWNNARLAGFDRTMSRVFWSEEDMKAYLDAECAAAPAAW